MKKLLISVSILFFWQILANSQDVMLASNEKAGFTSTADYPTEANTQLIEFKVQWLKTDQVKEVKSEDVDDHVFGELVARKMVLVDETFTYKVDIAPGNPAKKTMFRKPVIYNSVVDIERFLKKKVRKTEISKEVAAQLFNTVLDVALNTYCCDTEKLEKVIRETKNTEELLLLFTQIVKVVKAV